MTLPAKNGGQCTISKMFCLSCKQLYHVNKGTRHEITFFPNFFSGYFKQLFVIERIKFNCLTQQQTNGGANCNIKNGRNKQ